MGNPFFEDRSALVFKGYKYIYWPEDGREELYDLARDPGEQHSLVGSETERLEELPQVYRVRVDTDLELSRSLGVVEQPANIPQAVRNELRALGYLN